MATPSFPGPPVVPMTGGRATWNGRTVQECSDAIRWLTEATGGVLRMAESSPGGDALAELEIRVEALETANTALTAQVATLEATVATLQTQVTQIDTDLDTTNTDVDALEARVAALEAPAP